MKSHIAVILESPQKGENIGFVARAMLNFGLNDLRIVSPRDGWPNRDAEATAVKAVSILEKAKVYHDFSESIANLNYVYVTTARSRNINKPFISSRDLSQDISARYNSGASKVGIVFGPERSGISNDVLSLCNKIIHIPVGAEFGSLNLGMAAGLICYEASRVFLVDIKSRVPEGIALQREVDNLLQRLDAMLQDTNFYQVSEKRAAMVQNLNSLVKRIDGLTTNEVNTLIGIFRSLYEYQN